VPRRRRSLISLTFVLALLLLAPACGLRHHTVQTRTGTLTVTPPSGKTGTPFSLSAAGFRPGEALTFEVDIPGHSPYIGPSHTADPQGAVSTTYVPLGGDPPGTYQIKAVGNHGTRAQGTVIVSG
jgi:hypothetical protein